RRIVWKFGFHSRHPLRMRKESHGVREKRASWVSMRTWASQVRRVSWATSTSISQEIDSLLTWATSLLRFRVSLQNLPDGGVVCAYFRTSWANFVVISCPLNPVAQT